MKIDQKKMIFLTNFDQIWNFKLCKTWINA